MHAMISRLKQKEGWEEKPVGVKSVALGSTKIFTKEGFAKLKSKEAVTHEVDCFDGECLVYKYISNNGMLAMWGFDGMNYMLICHIVPLSMTMSRHSGPTSERNS